MKEEFEKHRFEIRNEFVFDGREYYNAVKNGIKLNVGEYAFGIHVDYKRKGVYLPKELMTWENLARSLREDFKRRAKDEAYRIARAMEASEKRTMTYKKIEEMFDDQA